MFFNASLAIGMTALLVGILLWSLTYYLMNRLAVQTTRSSMSRGFGDPLGELFGLILMLIIIFLATAPLLIRATKILIFGAILAWASLFAIVIRAGNHSVAYGMAIITALVLSWIAAGCPVHEFDDNLATN